MIKYTQILSESSSIKMSEKIRDEIDSVRSFEKEHLGKSNDPKSAIIFNETYETYKDYCHLVGKKDIQAKNDFKKQLVDWVIKLEVPDMAIRFVFSMFRY